MPNLIKDIILIMTGSLGKGLHPGIPVLTYHSIDKSGSVISRHPSDFRNDIRTLTDIGIKCIDWETLISENDARSDKLTSNLKRDRVVITFDDGYQNNFTEALPILNEYNAKASFFISTGYIGQENIWEEETSVPRLKMMTEDQLRNLKNSGMSVLPHGTNHIDLTRLNMGQMEVDIRASGEILESIVGKFQKHFCYPYGKYNEDLQKVLVNLGYKYAISTDPGYFNDDDDNLAVKRFGSNAINSKLSLSSIVMGDYTRFLKFKRIISNFKR